MTIGVHCLHTRWDNEVLPNLSAQVTRQEMISGDDKKKTSKIGSTPEHAPDDSILHKDVSVKRLIVIDNFSPFNDETVTLRKDRQRRITEKVQEKKKEMR